MEKVFDQGILQAHPHPRESAENFRSRWRDREVVLVCQSTLARWREGRDPNHSLPILAQIIMKATGTDHSCSIRAFLFKTRRRRLVVKYRSVESSNSTRVGRNRMPQAEQEFYLSSNASSGFMARC